MLEEAPKEYALASAEAAYEDPGEYAPMGIMSSAGGFHDGNASHWVDQKQPSFPSPTYSDNTNRKTAAVCMSVY